MIKNIIHNFIRGLKPFAVIVVMIGIFIGLISLAMISRIFWWICFILIIFGFICGIGSARDKK
jgi:uncharacterized membrane protein YiaA